MEHDYFKRLLLLFEARRPEIKYKVTPKEVIAQLEGNTSGKYTKLAQKINRIGFLQAQLSRLKEEVKASAREDIADLFDAEDAVKTRIVETLQFVFVLSKNPEITKTPKYKDILSELETKLTPELILVLEALKAELITETQKEPSLKVKPVSESKGDDRLERTVKLVNLWKNAYDKKLYALIKDADLPDFSV